MENQDRAFLPFLFNEPIFLTEQGEKKEQGSEQPPTKQASGKNTAPTKKAKAPRKARLLVVHAQDWTSTDEEVWHGILGRLQIATSVYERHALNGGSLEETDLFKAMLPEQIILTGCSGQDLENMGAKWYESFTLQQCPALAVPSFQEMKADRAGAGKSSWQALKPFLA